MSVHACHELVVAPIAAQVGASVVVRRYDIASQLCSLRLEIVQLPLLSKDWDFSRGG